MNGRGAAALSWEPGRFDLLDVTDRGTLRHRA
jgi:hypothetical protein